MLNAYKNLLSEAFERANKMDADTKSVSIMADNKRRITYTNEENKTGVLKHLFRCLGDIKADYVRHNGTEMHLKFKSYLEDYLNCKVVLTIGGVYFKGKEVFRFNEYNINQFSGTEINPHVWYTLPSMEIIDLTFLEYYNYKRGLPFRYQKEYEYVFDSIDNIYKNENITYMPTLVGSESLNRINLKKNIKCEKITV